MRTALIDGDIIAYKMAAAAQETYGFSGEKRATVLDPVKARRDIDSYITELAELTKSDDVLICLTDEEREWRKEYWPAYKAKRDPSRKPELLALVRDHVRKEWPTKTKPLLEADDVLGILSTHPTLIPGEKVIVSEDKDLRTIPGLLFNPRKSTKVERISELDADRFFIWQAVVGDQTDGYPGVRGIGPKSKWAAAILNAPTAEVAWRIARTAYLTRHPDPDEAEKRLLFQARLARILRHGDYHYKTGCPRLWTPPWAPSLVHGIAPDAP